MILRRNCQAISPQEVNTQGKKLDIIQALRFFGAAVIFLYHAQYLLPHGYAAVELFCMISGYIIIYSTQSERSRNNFLLKRVIRIVPLYWMLTFSFFIIIRIRPSLSLMSEPRLEYLIKSLFFIPFLNSYGYDTPILIVGWTLNYEMFFYLTFYLAMWINHKRRAGLSIGISVLLVAAGIIFHPQNLVFRYYTDSFLLEFSMGILAFYLVKCLQPYCKNRSMRSACGVISCIAFIWLISDPHADSILPRCIRCGIPAFICLCTALLAWSEAKVPCVLVRLGNTSYSFYLIEVFTTKFCVLATQNKSFFIQTIVVLLLFAATLICSCISYQIIELRLAGFLKNKLLSPVKTVES